MREGSQKRWKCNNDEAVMKVEEEERMDNALNEQG
jgi:hypothetical protein